MYEQFDCVTVCPQGHAMFSTFIIILQIKERTHVPSNVQESNSYSLTSTGFVQPVTTPVFKN